MRITPKLYATGLLQALHNKQGAEIAPIIDAFVALLAKNNDTAKADKVIAAFSALWNKEHKIITSEITTAKKLGNDTRDSLEAFLLKQSGARAVEIQEKIDGDVLGGMVIRYEDTVLDYSVKTKISDLISAIKQ
ncbi:MAG: ATP synthase F1 subunit delta [Candidatus Azambacteria bacterium]|nr:ATP synthase F1 subunit delta [Candidatus Azambacteria bacterium]